MSQNPYQPSTATVCPPAPNRTRSACALGSIAGSLGLFLIGGVVVALGLLPSDAPRFFFLNGSLLIVCGAAALACAWSRGSGWVGQLLCWLSLIFNAGFAVRLALLLSDGTLQGPLIVAAPLLIGVPTLLNFISAVLDLRRGNARVG